MAEQKKLGRKPSPATQQARKMQERKEPKEYSIPSGAVHVCTCCGKHATKSSLEKLFYMSYSPFHAKTGRVQLCKDCMVAMSTYSGQFKNDMFSEVLRVIDKPYLESELESSINQIIVEFERNGETKTKEYVLKNKISQLIGVYIKNISLNFKEYTWMDGESRTAISSNPNLANNGEYESIEVEYLRQRWGKDLVVDDLRFLEEKYAEWENGYEVDTKNRQLIVENLVYEELFIYKERQQGKDVSKRLKNIKDLMGLGNLSPRQETASEGAEFGSFASMIAHIEQHKPAYVENHALKDIDNMGENIKILEGLIARTAGKSNENTQLFEEEYAEETMDLTSLSGGGTNG